MDALLDPKVLTAILTAAGAGVAWCWGKYYAAHMARKKEIEELQERCARCEQERAVLKERLTRTREELAVERGRVDALTDLFKKEANLA